MDSPPRLSPTPYNGPKYTPRKDITPLKSILRKTPSRSPQDETLRASSTALVFQQRHRLKLAYQAKDAGDVGHCASLCEGLLEEGDALSLLIVVEVLHLLARLKEPAEAKRLLEAAVGKLDAACDDGKMQNFMELRRLTSVHLDEVEETLRGQRRQIEEAEAKFLRGGFVEHQGARFEMVDISRSGSKQMTSVAPNLYQSPEGSISTMQLSKYDDTNADIQQGNVAKHRPILKLRRSISKLFSRGQQDDKNVERSSRK